MAVENISSRKYGTGPILYVHTLRISGLWNDWENSHSYALFLFYKIFECFLVLKLSRRILSEFTTNLNYNIKSYN